MQKTKEGGGVLTSDMYLTSTSELDIQSQNLYWQTTVRVIQIKELAPGIHEMKELARTDIHKSRHATATRLQYSIHA